MIEQAADLALLKKDLGLDGDFKGGASSSLPWDMKEFLVKAIEEVRRDCQVILEDCCRPV